MQDIENIITQLMVRYKPSTIHIYEADPTREGKYRSIEKFSISIALDGKLIPNFKFVNSPWNHSVTLKKKHKDAKKHVTLLTPPVDFEVKYGKVVKRKVQSFKKTTLKLMFDTECRYTDGTHRYEKNSDLEEG
jgi:hypothetical protein